MDKVTTLITGTFTERRVGEIIQNVRLSRYERIDVVSVKVIRISSEEEYRKVHNYSGPLPGVEHAYFYEIVALD